jgi:glycosyltransferase involved in cell wall biosynthesis
VLEYMASRLPFIVTDTGEVTRAVRGLPIGYTPAPRDPIELADAMAALLALSPDERRAMGRRGRAVAEDVFDQQRVTRQIEQVYHQLLTTQRGEPATTAGVVTGADPTHR